MDVSYDNGQQFTYLCNGAISSTWKAVSESSESRLTTKAGKSNMSTKSDNQERPPWEENQVPEWWMQLAVSVQISPVQQVLNATVSTKGRRFAENCNRLNFALRRNAFLSERLSGFVLGPVSAVC
jgi:hypothetical protein